MRKLYQATVAGVLFLVLQGCGAPCAEWEYKAVPWLVAEPQFGEGNISAKEPVIARLDWAIIVFAPFEIQEFWSSFFYWRPGIAFALKNLLDRPLKINWEESGIIIDGVAGRLVPSGTKFLSIDRPQSPRFVPPEATIEDSVFPVKYIKGTSLRDVAWAEFRKQEITVELYLTLEAEGLGKKAHRFRWKMYVKEGAHTEKVCVKKAEKK